MKPDARAFFSNEIVGYRFVETDSTAIFDLVFKPCQLFSWQEFYRMCRLGVRLACTHQDSIAVRCRYIGGASLTLLHRNMPQLMDRIVAISEFTRADFNALHNSAVDFPVIHQGTDPVWEAAPGTDGYVLLLGNGFVHKALDHTVAVLAGIGRLVVLGGNPPVVLPAGVEWRESGNLARTEITGLYLGASVVVYPSYYEGFGLPVLDTLALGRPVVVLDSEVSRELMQLTQDPNLHLAESHSAMRDIISQLRTADPFPCKPQRNWDQVAAEYATVLEDLLARDPDIGRLRYRWNWLATMDSQSSLL
jgi:glycosyltransferase involved in cell wall biosynthesis